MARRSKPAPWYHDFRTRLRFEREARKSFSTMGCKKVGKGKGAEIVYVVAVPVPEYEVTRTLTIRLRNRTEPALIDVTVDGPIESPHRYSRARLCMWPPWAAPEECWTPDEGLLGLIQYARIHLFREEYWRETGGLKGGIWAGPEAPHDGPKEEAA